MFRFQAVFRDSASDCTAVTLAEDLGSHLQPWLCDYAFSDPDTMSTYQQGSETLFHHMVSYLSPWHADAALARRLDHRQPQEMTENLRQMPTLAHGDVIEVE